MELIHILPKKNLVRESRPRQKYELYLVDEVLRDPDFYIENVRSSPGYKILDNSLNELGFSRSLNYLEKAAELILADEFVIPDAISSEASIGLLEKFRNRAWLYPKLCSLKKMAVVHGSSADEIAESYSRLSRDKLVDVIGIPKVIEHRAELVADLGRPDFKEVHFLGFRGFEEFKGYEYVTRAVRSMDSRVMLYNVGRLGGREDVLSQVPLDGDTFIKNVEREISRARKEYEGYGLC